MYTTDKNNKDKHYKEIAMKEGIIGSDLVIKPVPIDVLLTEENEVENFENISHSYFDLLAANTSNKTIQTVATAPHFIIKNQKISRDFKNDYLSLPGKQGIFNRQEGTSNQSRNVFRSKRDISAVYPEVLIIVDYSTFVYYDRNHDVIKNRYVNILNMVSLQY
ncbi:hypothetical protein CEXT_241031 [Caerostris extrusa]|uniref:Uncharacterized protein n=1 Tax=Caerostris extrusa TaxID=172846 RepID=A0AAV4NBD1_CAEEX|nr:hypothetical protein CEXT_241031 [Caerostris extrusa]